MFELLSHLFAFGVLSAAAVSDLRTTEVPDWLSIAGVAGGILLHLAASLHTGAWRPLQLSLAIGAIFSIYGWGMYYVGMWGGADAFAVSILGFAAPYPVTGFEVAHPVNLFINIMLVGFLYTVGFALWKGYGNDSVVSDFRERVFGQKLRLTLELVAAVIVSVAGQLYFGMNGIFYLIALFLMVFLYRFLRAVEEEAMAKKIPKEELEGGEVISEVDGKIRGATEDEIEELELEEVEVKSGVKFVPVFPIALLITDIFGGGLQFFALFVL